MERLRIFVELFNSGVRHSRPSVGLRLCKMSATNLQKCEFSASAAASEEKRTKEKYMPIAVIQDPNVCPYKLLVIPVEFFSYHIDIVKAACATCIENQNKGRVAQFVTTVNDQDDCQLIHVSKVCPNRPMGALVKEPSNYMLKMIKTCQIRGSNKKSCYPGEEEPKEASSSKSDCGEDSSKSGSGKKDKRKNLKFPMTDNLKPYRFAINCDEKEKKTDLLDKQVAYEHRFKESLDWKKLIKEYEDPSKKQGIADEFHNAHDNKGKAKDPHTRKFSSMPICSTPFKMTQGRYFSDGSEFDKNSESMRSDNNESPKVSSKVTDKHINNTKSLEQFQKEFIKFIDTRTNENEEVADKEKDVQHKENEADENATNVKVILDMATNTTEEQLQESLTKVNKFLTALILTPVVGKTLESFGLKPKTLEVQSHEIKCLNEEECEVCEYEQNYKIFHVPEEGLAYKSLGNEENENQVRTMEGIDYQKEQSPERYQQTGHKVRAFSSFRNDGEDNSDRSAAAVVVAGQADSLEKKDLKKNEKDSRGFIDLVEEADVNKNERLIQSLEKILDMKDLNEASMKTFFDQLSKNFEENHEIDPEILNAMVEEVNFIEKNVKSLESSLCESYRLIQDFRKLRELLNKTDIKERKNLLHNLKILETVPDKAAEIAKEEASSRAMLTNTEYINQDKNLFAEKKITVAARFFDYGNQDKFLFQNHADVVARNLMKEQQTDSVEDQPSKVVEVGEFFKQAKEHINYKPALPENLESLEPNEQDFKHMELVAKHSDSFMEDFLKKYTKEKAGTSKDAAPLSPTVFSKIFEDKSKVLETQDDFSIDPTTRAEKLSLVMERLKDLEILQELPEELRLNQYYDYDNFQNQENVGLASSLNEVKRKYLKETTNENESEPKNQQAELKTKDEIAKNEAEENKVFISESLRKKNISSFMPINTWLYELPFLPNSRTEEAQDLTKIEKQEKDSSSKKEEGKMLMVEKPAVQVLTNKNKIDELHKVKIFRQLAEDEKEKNRESSASGFNQKENLQVASKQLEKVHYIMQDEDQLRKQKVFVNKASLEDFNKTQAKQNQILMNRVAQKVKEAQKPEEKENDEDKTEDRDFKKLSLEEFQKIINLTNESSIDQEEQRGHTPETEESQNFLEKLGFPKNAKETTKQPPKAKGPMIIKKEFHQNQNIDDLEQIRLGIEEFQSVLAAAQEARYKVLHTAQNVFVKSNIPLIDVEGVIDHLSQDSFDNKDSRLAQDPEAIFKSIERLNSNFEALQEVIMETAEACQKIFEISERNELVAEQIQINTNKILSNSEILLARLDKTESTSAFVSSENPKQTLQGPEKTLNLPEILEAAQLYQKTISNYNQSLFPTNSLNRNVDENTRNVEEISLELQKVSKELEGHVKTSWDLLESFEKLNKLENPDSFETSKSDDDAKQLLGDSDFDKIMNRLKFSVVEPSIDQNAIAQPLIEAGGCPDQKEAIEEKVALKAAIDDISLKKENLDRVEWPPLETNLDFLSEAHKEHNKKFGFYQYQAPEKIPLNVVKSEYEKNEDLIPHLIFDKATDCQTSNEDLQNSLKSQIKEEAPKVIGRAIDLENFTASVAEKVLESYKKKNEGSKDPETPSTSADSEPKKD